MLTKLRKATTLLIDCDSDLSFYKTIIDNIDTFKGFNIIYSCNKLLLNGNTSELPRFLKQYRFIHTYFKYNNVFFFRKEFFDNLINKGSVEIPALLYFIIDSNVAEAVRVMQNGGTPSPAHELYQFIDLAAKIEIGMDYTFFKLENFNDLKNSNNPRPKQTISAIRQVNNLIAKNGLSKFQQPVDEEIKEFINNQLVNTLWSQRRGIYLLLLKTYIEQWESYDFNKKFENIYTYSFRVFNKFAKIELFFIWKFLRNPNEYAFFNPPLQKGKNTLKFLKSISGDLFFLRYAEQMTKIYKDQVFHIPVLISFDEKYFNWLKVCPVKFVIYDFATGAVNTVFEDEYQFQEFLLEVLNKTESIKLFENVDLINNRWNGELDLVKIENEIRSLEKKIEEIIAAL